jgi:hypothetical protein
VRAWKVLVRPPARAPIRSKALAMIASKLAASSSALALNELDRLVVVRPTLSA